MLFERNQTNLRIAFVLSGRLRHTREESNCSVCPHIVCYSNERTAGEVLPRCIDPACYVICCLTLLPQPFTECPHAPVTSSRGGETPSLCRGCSRDVQSTSRKHTKRSVWRGLFPVWRACIHARASAIADTLHQHGNWNISVIVVEHLALTTSDSHDTLT